MLEQTKARELLERDLIDRKALLEQIDGALANFANARSWARPSAGAVLREVKRVVIAMPTTLEAGRAEERERVVAWLRQNASSMNATSSTAIADYIERGEHIAKGEGRG